MKLEKKRSGNAQNGPKSSLTVQEQKKKQNKNINAFSITLLIQHTEPNTSSEVDMRRKKV